MEKLKCTVYAPIREYSFFGSKSRIFIKSLVENRPDFDIRIVDYRLPNHRFIKGDPDLNKLIDGPWEDTDVSFYFGHPNLFNPIGKKANFGFVDTTEIFSAEDAHIFIDKCNQMNMIFVCSNYAKMSLNSLKYSNGEVEIKINKPIIITTEYSVINEIDDVLDESLLKDVVTSRNFLCEGYFEPEENDTFGGKNKDNIEYVVRNFLETFKDIEDAPGLILNVRGNLAGVVNREQINERLVKIQKLIRYENYLPKVYLINGYLEDIEIKTLYNDPKIIAMIHTPQRTDTIEPELNFMSTGKPIIFSGFGSQKEALDYSGNYAVGYQLKKINIYNGEGPHLVDIYGDKLKLGLYEVFYHYDYMHKHAIVGSNEFLSSNNKARMLHIFNEAVKYLVPTPEVTTEIEKKKTLKSKKTKKTD